MKQFISKEQFGELSKKAKDRAMKSFNTQFGMSSDLKWDELNSTGKSLFTEKITIGAMIEFLDEHSTTNWQIILHKPSYDVLYSSSDISPDFEDYKELCDGLFEVVKEILEK